MKDLLRRLVPKAGYIPLFFLLAVLSAPVASAATIPQKTTSAKVEAHLEIPKIKVKAVIKDMGVTAQGVMAIPGNRVDVGWWGKGTVPGQVGSAVFGGHNEWGNGAGVFADLHLLKTGDTMSVVDKNGHSTSFVVREIRTYNATDIDNGIFLSASGIHLNLITCSGTWDPKTKSYTKRLVVFTDVVQKT